MAVGVLIATCVISGFGIGFGTVVIAGLTNVGIANVGAGIGVAAGAAIIVGGAVTASSAYNEEKKCKKAEAKLVELSENLQTL